MGRFPQKEGERGSLRWIQKFIEERPDLLLPINITSVEWLSPLRQDDFAEYRDYKFLELIGRKCLAGDLGKWWPSGSPQWDAVGLQGQKVILVEAKAHLQEFFTPGTSAGPKSRERIEAALNETKDSLGAKSVSDWTQLFYQYANRLSWLDWLRKSGVDAKLLFVSFVGDTEMNGPNIPSEWEVAFRTADYALGLPKRHNLSRHIFHSYPDVSELAPSTA